MYADDTALLVDNKLPVQQEIQIYIAIGIAQQYCQASDLVLNEKKSQQIIMGRRKRGSCPF